MDIKLDLSEETISRMVSDSIMRSAIGKALDEAVKKSILGSNSYEKSPFQKAVDKAVEDMVFKHVREDGPIKDSLDKAIKIALENMAGTNAFEALVGKFVEKLKVSDY